VPHTRLLHSVCRSASAAVLTTLLRSAVLLPLLLKAALNQLTVCFAREEETVVSVALSPGWVQTEMGTKGGRRPPLTVERSVSSMLKLIDGLSLQDSGKFLDYDGTQLPW
jgi:hypothetical protein